jgi:hypothetical protein
VTERAATSAASVAGEVATYLCLLGPGPVPLGRGHALSEGVHTELSCSEEACPPVGRSIPPTGLPRGIVRILYLSALIANEGFK